VHAYRWQTKAPDQMNLEAGARSIANPLAAILSRDRGRTEALFVATRVAKSRVRRLDSTRAANALVQDARAKPRVRLQSANTAHTQSSLASRYALRFGRHLRGGGAAHPAPPVSCAHIVGR